MTKRRNTSALELKGDGDFVRRSARNTVKGVTQEEVATLYADPEIQTLLAGINKGNNLQTVQPEDSEEKPLVVPVQRLFFEIFVHDCRSNKSKSTNTDLHPRYAQETLIWSTYIHVGCPQKMLCM